MLSHSVVSNSVTPWTVAHQAPLPMGILQARILFSPFLFSLKIGFYFCENSVLLRISIPKSFKWYIWHQVYGMHARYISLIIFIFIDGSDYTRISKSFIIWYFIKEKLFWHRPTYNPEVHSKNKLKLKLAIFNESLLFRRM